MLLTWCFQFAICRNFKLTSILFARILSLGYCANRDCQSAEICDISNKCFIHEAFHLYILFLWISIEILFNALSLFEIYYSAFYCTNMHLSKFVFFSPFPFYLISLKLKITQIWFEYLHSDITNIRQDVKTEISMRKTWAYQVIASSKQHV